MRSLAAVPDALERAGATFLGQRRRRGTATVGFAAEALPHLNRIHALACRVKSSDGDAEELTQETFARACAAYGSFTPGSDMLAWLTTILLNIARADARRRRLEVVPLADGATVADAHLSDADALRNLDRADVLAAVDALPEPFRLAICLVDLVGLPVKEAAAVLDVPVGTVLSRLSRGRSRLARTLARERDRGR